MLVFSIQVHFNVNYPLWYKFIIFTDNLIYNEVFSQSRNNPIQSTNASNAVDGNIATCTKQWEIWLYSEYNTVCWMVDLNGVYIFYRMTMLFEAYMMGTVCSLSVQLVCIRRTRILITNKTERNNYFDICISWHTRIILGTVPFWVIAFIPFQDMLFF